MTRARSYAIRMMGTGFAAGMLGAALAAYASDRASAGSACPASIPEALRHARAASNDDALACLIEAVAALDARLTGLSDGSIAFEGQIHLPQGFVISKPPASEGE